MKIKIEDIQRKLSQIKLLNNNSYSTVKELAKELKVSNTELLDFLSVNSKLVIMDHYRVFTGKTKKEKVFGNREVEQKIYKDVGLVVFNVYQKADENPKNDEYSQRIIKENVNKIIIKRYNNYGNIHGYYIQIDSLINTQDKILSILDKHKITKKAGYTIGGFGDSYYHEIDKAWDLSEEDVELLKKDWLVDIKL